MAPLRYDIGRGVMWQSSAPMHRKGGNGTIITKEKIVFMEPVQWKSLKLRPSVLPPPLIYGSGM